MSNYFKQLAALLITRQVIGNFQEAIIPYFYEKYKLSRLAYKMTRKMSDKSLQKHVEDLKERNNKLLNQPSASLQESYSAESSATENTVRSRKTTNSSRLAVPEFKVFIY